eukprot:364479-Chlamydomonas_euryale.AAC.4
MCHWPAVNAAMLDKHHPHHRHAILCAWQLYTQACAAHVVCQQATTCMYGCKGLACLVSFCLAVPPVASRRSCRQLLRLKLGTTHHPDAQRYVAECIHHVSLNARSTCRCQRIEGYHCEAHA